jgi:steroid delta-isomerase-like uncharacterized protein
LAALTLSACGSNGEDAAGTNARPTASAGSGSTSNATAERNGRTMERFIGEFLPTGDVALAEEFISPDIVMHFAGQKQRGRDAYLDIVAANVETFPDLVWTVQDMVAYDDTVAVRYTMTGTGTHRGTFAGVPATGTAVRAESMAFYRLLDGQIVAERAQLDMLGLLQHLGDIAVVGPPRRTHGTHAGVRDVARRQRPGGAEQDGSCRCDAAIRAMSRDWASPPHRPGTFPDRSSVAPSRCARRASGPPPTPAAAGWAGTTTRADSRRPGVRWVR